LSTETEAALRTARAILRLIEYIHYWAVYQRFDVTIVYDSPFAYDKSVAIYFILINYKPFIPIGPSVIC